MTEVIEWKGRVVPTVFYATMSMRCDDFGWELVKAIDICYAHAHVNLYSMV